MSVAFCVSGGREDKEKEEPECQPGQLVSLFVVAGAEAGQKVGVV